MNTIKSFFDNIDSLDLKIMKTGIKFCYYIILFATFLLLMYIFAFHTFFLYNLGITLIKIGTYFISEFIICGLVCDYIKNGH